MSAIVQQLKAIKEQCSDSAVVFLVLVLLQHHIASNSKREVNKKSQSLDNFFMLGKKNFKYMRSPKLYGGSTRVTRRECSLHGETVKRRKSVLIWRD